MQEKIFKNLVNGIDVHVCFADVCVMKAEACVVPRFSERIADTGIATMLSHVGYSRGVQAYDELFERYGLSKLPFGTAFTMNAFTGSYAWLIHVPVLDADSFEAYDAVIFAVYAALHEADNMSLYDIVIPVPFDGHKGFLDCRQSARAMLTALKSFRSKNNSLREVKFVVSKNEAAYLEFVSCIDDGFGDIPAVSGLEESYLQIVEPYLQIMKTCRF